jgi:dTDP-glucose pyrophosphorylase
MQWGTPDDVEEYNNWSTIFKKLIHKTHSLVHKGIRIIPMAGLGKRFSEEGYTTTKSLLSVSGMPMVAQALNDLPKTDSNIFIIRNNMDDQDQIIEYLNTNFTDSKILSVPGVTEGQACTAQFGVRGLNDDEGPLIFGACDNGVIYDQDHLKDTLNEDYDVIVWGVRNHINACRNPNSYGWIECDNLNNITSVSVKKPINSEYNNPVILGTFIFRNAQTFNDIVDDLISSGKRVNGEFYLDSAVNTAIDKCLNVKFFEVDHFLCWGTPDELKTFEYWQSCFSKWQSHPYELAKDKMIPENMVDEIAHEYKKFSF